MDGICKCVIIHPDGCKECKKGNVQFLFLFNDCFAGLVCQQNVDLTPTSYARSFAGTPKERELEDCVFLNWIKRGLLLNKEILYKSATPMKMIRINKAWHKKIFI